MLLSATIRLALKILVIAASAMAFDAAATVTCSSSLGMSPSLPTRVVVPPNAVVGTLLYRGTMTSTQVCSGVETSSLGYTHTIIDGGSSPVAMATNSSVGLQSRSSGTVTWTGTCPAMTRVTSSSASKQLLGVSWGSGASFSSCTITVAMPLELVVMQLPVSTANITGSSVVIGQCANATPWGCTNVSTGGVTTSVISLGDGTAIPVVKVGGCTLAVTSYSVTLPDVTVSTLNASGRTAGQTPFSLAFAGCSSELSYGVSALWDFIEDGSVNNIANTAANPAQNAVTQILDANLVPVANQQLTVLQSSAAAGARNIQFYARYYAKGAVTTGQVLGTATFTLVYQ